VREKSKYKYLPLAEHYAAPKQLQYSSIFTRGKGQIFVMGSLNTPFGVLIVTTRAMTSLPGWVSLMTAVG